MLVERGRIELDLPLAEWLDAAVHPGSVQVVSITPPIAAAWPRCRSACIAIRPIV
jgi:PIN domain nuclease of toxin-antitoxin system